MQYLNVGNIMNNRTSRHSEATSKVPTPSHQRNFSPGYLKILEAGPLLKINPVSNHQCHQSEINDICVTSSGDHFITAGSDASVRIFQMSSGRRVNSVESSSSTVCVDVSQCQDCSTDQWLTAGGSDGSCRVWNMLSGALRLRFTGHASKIQACKILG